jgi:predicted unusual protein kinase regulating ubiquinone biosynthesis (AarF/ABC1/UbiB family)
MVEVEVAVKVQRPNVLSEIALDVFITREIAPYYQKFTMNDTNLQCLADEWGRGFISELTYDQEAKNTILFNQEMEAKNMNAVCAPTVITELSTDRVLTTEWVNGIRLDRSEEEDVARLCGVALNAYLVMLLETGTLHCGEFYTLVFVFV